MKFLQPPKHALDIKSHKAVVHKLNALLNAKIVDEHGNTIGVVQYADGNTVFQFKASGDGSALAAFAVTALSGGDFFVARQLSNFRLDAGVPTADVGAADFKIAKTRITRRSITQEKIDGNIITYRDAGTSDNDNNRIANDGSQDESQCVYPRYQAIADLGFTDTVPMDANCVIYAQQVGTACGVFDGTTALEWLEEPGRVWAKRFA